MRLDLSSKITLERVPKKFYRPENDFEEYNLATGERTICGIRVPPEAPPRPDSTSVWNSEWKEWRDF